MNKLILYSKLLKYFISLYYWDLASEDKVRRMQLKKFIQIFDHARKRSKFYREFYGDHGVLDLEIKTYSDVKKVPIITKEILRNYSTRDIMTCDIGNDINIHSTSGSTGEPFKIAFNKFEDYTSHVRLTKEMIKHGYNPFKKVLLLSRYEIEDKFEVEEDLSTISMLQNKFGLFRRNIISIFKPIKNIISKLKEIKPFVLWSTPSMIQLIAIELKKRNEQINIPLLVLMSETISSEQIDLFRRWVCRDCLDIYGCMESPSIGFSFNQIISKKIISTSAYVEVVNKRGEKNNEVGDIIITNLLNKTMPFIRYDIGDYVGVLGERQFPYKKIGSIYGRFDDIIHFGNDYTLTYHQTYQLFRNFHECEQYKFIQRVSGSIVLQLKVNQTANKEFILNKAMDRWSEKYPNYPLTIEWKESFPIDKKTGKFKVIEKEDS
ncbi:MAG: hypothetical protein PF638_11950 [Candidatus Delongbacteria bacterium]|nr:hypothetical protein [Candidatus Delongbacteria bacterium]